MALDDIFVVIRRKHLSIFVEGKEKWTVKDLKEEIQYLIHGRKQVVLPENMRLYKVEANNNVLLEKDTQTLGEYGLTVPTALAHAPAELGLAIKDPQTGDFEELTIDPLSEAPELPDVMKTNPSPASS